MKRDVSTGDYPKRKNPEPATSDSLASQGRIRPGTDSPSPTEPDTDTGPKGTDKGSQRVDFDS